MARVAVVLFNLGGPDSLDAVRPFLFNLFHDPAILSLPQPFRRALAWFIARRRAPVAKEIYRHMGGRSPLLAYTRDQASALQARLRQTLSGDAEVFIAMRYWHPMSEQTAREVQAFDPDEIVVLSLYPQYSTTTTGSSLKDWARAAERVGLKAKSRAICCAPTHPGWIGAVADLLRHHLTHIPTGMPFRVLFSAHGLPKRVIARGDPYQWQVEQTVDAVLNQFDPESIDSVICYQSRVGPLEWIGPSTDEEIKRAAGDRVAVVVVPIAFVSEHSETLVELDVEYRALAERHGVPAYVRVPAVAAHPQFINGLAKQVIKALGQAQEIQAGSVDWVCSEKYSQCPCLAAGQ